MSACSLRVCPEWRTGEVWGAQDTCRNLPPNPFPVRITTSTYAVGAASKSPSVKRVVLTSSCAAIYGNPHEFGKDHVYTEADWWG